MREDRFLEGLLRRESEAISARYRVSAEEALRALREAFAARPALVERIRQRGGAEDVTRWRDYRRAVRECRRRIYYGLRRYYAEPRRADALLEELEEECGGPARQERLDELRCALLGAHASTRERLPHYEEFYERFFELVGQPATLLDIGCGMHPLSYPFGGSGSATALYVGLDKDGRAVRAVRAWSRLLPSGRLVGIGADLSDVEWHSNPALAGPFELAVMLKVVPVLGRLSRDALRRLAEVPARRLVVTGSAEALARRERVERRERGVLWRFLRQAGRRVIGEFRAGAEFGYLAQ